MELLDLLQTCIAPVEYIPQIWVGLQGRLFNLGHTVFPHFPVPCLHLEDLSKHP